MRVIVPSLLFKVFIQNVVDIQCLVSNLLIKLCHVLKAQSLDQTHHGGFVILHLPVFELPFQCLFGEIVLACYHLFECLPYLGAGFGSRHDVEPVLFGSLGIRRHDFYLITAVQFLFELYILAVYFRTDTLASQFAMDMECEIEHGSSFGKFE